MGSGRGPISRSFGLRVIGAKDCSSVVPRYRSSGNSVRDPQAYTHLPVPKAPAGFGPFWAIHTLEEGPTQDHWAVKYCKKLSTEQRSPFEATRFTLPPQFGTLRSDHEQVILLKNKGTLHKVVEQFAHKAPPPKVNWGLSTPIHILQPLRGHVNA